MRSTWNSIKHSHFSFLSGEGKGNSMISGPRNLQ
ncbi:hypothetical protein NC652_015849 [Populus alba x Populus x berolinensis]|nr:hypothetical protein NC651_015358 [Populus alba x Populus x berolinensis]KAJ6922014.1 hypothetical protein NC652_015849 [Populus alba x Populus x berolinensis]